MPGAMPGVGNDTTMEEERTTFEDVDPPQPEVKLENPTTAPEPNSNPHANFATTSRPIGGLSIKTTQLGVTKDDRGWFSAHPGKTQVLPQQVVTPQPIPLDERTGVTIEDISDENEGDTTLVHHPASGTYVRRKRETVTQYNPRFASPPTHGNKQSQGSGTIIPYQVGRYAEHHHQVYPTLHGSTQPPMLESYTQDQAVVLHPSQESYNTLGPNNPMQSLRFKQQLEIAKLRLMQCIIR
ncbi:hypothetical protein B0J17DRAFT_631945 [Rhizoctonia solani]|nr:hypothetical protein B0J17DRAFT_631945 [Rhizoctonia solani]